MRRAELDQQLGWAGAQETIDKGMYKEYTNRFGVLCVVKTEEEERVQIKHSQAIQRQKTVDGLY